MQLRPDMMLATTSKSLRDTATPTGDPDDELAQQPQAVGIGRLRAAQGERS